MIKQSHFKKFGILTLITLLLLNGCGSEKAEDKPELNQIQSVCEMATLKCTYHNVAKTEKPVGNGFFNFGKKPRKFWIDYQGTVEISFDVNKIQMHQDKTNIDITLPEPKLRCDIVQGSWNANSQITEPDHLFFQKNPITAEDQTEAISNAQEDMKKQVKNNSSLITTAESQAKQLIKNYIDRIGEATNTNYTITWHSADTSEGTNTMTTSSSAESAK